MHTLSIMSTQIIKVLLPDFDRTSRFGKDAGATSIFLTNQFILWVSGANKYTINQMSTTYCHTVNLGSLGFWGRSTSKNT